MKGTGEPDSGNHRGEPDKVSSFEIQKIVFNSGGTVIS
jgi:hypothetical protein